MAAPHPVLHAHGPGPVRAGQKDGIEHLPVQARQGLAAEEVQRQTVVLALELRDVQLPRLAQEVDPVHRAAFAREVHGRIRQRAQLHPEHGV